MARDPLLRQQGSLMLMLEDHPRGAVLHVRDSDIAPVSIGLDPQDVDAIVEWFLAGQLPEVPLGGTVRTLERDALRVIREGTPTATEAGQAMADRLRRSVDNAGGTWVALPTERLAEAANLLDPTGTPGAGGAQESAPEASQTDAGPDTGARDGGESTLRGVQDRPEVTHSGEQEASPAQRRDAWLSLVRGLEAHLVTTLVNARAQVRIQARGTAEWEATAWAAQRLLDQVLALPAPEVPRDDTLGQLTLDDADTMRYVGQDGERWRLISGERRGSRSVWGCTTVNRDNLTLAELNDIHGPLREVD